MDQPPDTAPAFLRGPGRRSFVDHLRAAPALREFATEFSYTPPVPGPASGLVVLYAFMRRGLPPATPDVYPPDYRIRARWPAAEVTAVEPVTAASIGVTLVDGQTLGPNKLPPPHDGPATSAQMLAEDANFEEAQAALLSAFWAERSPKRADCVRYLTLLPVYASSPLVPLLRRTSPAFFSAVDRCAAER